MLGRGDEEFWPEVETRKTTRSPKKGENRGKESETFDIRLKGLGDKLNFVFLTSSWWKIKHNQKKGEEERLRSFRQSFIFWVGVRGLRFVRDGGRRRERSKVIR